MVLGQLGFRLAGFDPCRFREARSAKVQLVELPHHLRELQRTARGSISKGVSHRSEIVVARGVRFG